MPSFQQALSVQKLKQKLDLIAIDQLAKTSGFIKRKPKKIFPIHLIISLFLVVLGSGNSLDNLASKIGLLSAQTVSKQSVFKRINENLIKFLQAILATAIMFSAKIKDQPKRQSHVLASFNRVLVNDSTSIKLDAKLAEDFPGSKNQSGKKNATLKIQATLDILTQQFCYFDISAFTKNDQRASKDILSIAQALDLVIRDLGYFSCAVFKQLDQRKIFFFEPA